MRVLEEIVEKCCSHCEAECDGCWLKQSLTDYTKQVRKEVCEYIGKNVAVDIINFNVYVRYDDLAKILDQIQGEIK